jgi:very-short-patch-repair endonuclease
MEVDHGPTLSGRRPHLGAGLGQNVSKNDIFPPRSVRLIGGRLISVAPGALIDERIRMIVERQRGRVARWQLLAAGIDPGAIVRRVRSGRLMRIHSGVYGVAHTEDIPLAAETAALLAGGNGAVLSHHSAAVLWGLRPGVARPVHVMIPGERHGAVPYGVKIHRSVKLTAADVRVHDGLPVTSPARTLLDVAATLPDRDVERLLDEALFARRIARRSEVVDVLKRAGHHPGRGRLARLIGTHAGSTDTESKPEEALYRLILAAGLPRPKLQVSILDYRLDFYWPELRLAVEVDAYGTHGSPARFEADRRRDARLLTEKGILVIRLTKAMIDERTWEALGLVARAIGQREAQLRMR